MLTHTESLEADLALLPVLDLVAWKLEDALRPIVARVEAGSRARLLLPRSDALGLLPNVPVVRVGTDGTELTETP